MTDFTPEEQRLADAFGAVQAPETVGEWRSRPSRRFRGGPDWVRPLAAVLAVAVVGGGLGGYLGFRAATGGGGTGGTAPPARASAAMAYDEATGTVVLFGGFGVKGNLADTWTWDGSSWTERHPATSPSARGGALMAYDPGSQKVVLFGGGVAGGFWSGYTPLNGSGSSWIGCAVAGAPVSPGSTPVPKPSLPPECTSNAGVSPLIPNPDLHDTWVWDGSNWHQAAAAGPDVLPGTTQIATDPVRGGVLMVSLSAPTPALGLPCPLQTPKQSSDVQTVPNGCSGGEPTYTAYTWDGAVWHQAAPPPPASDLGYSFSPGLLVNNPLTGHLGYFREQTPFVTLCGSISPGQPLVLPTPAASGAPAIATGPPTIVSPAPPETAPCTPNPKQSDACCTGSISEWTGAAWTAGTSFQGAPAFAGGVGSAVGDPATHSVMYVLGKPGQTWVWTGKWVKLSPATQPPAIYGAASAYDSKKGQVVLFGGLSLESLLPTVGITDQTWTWDGANWTLRAGSSTPVTLPSQSVPPFPSGIPCPMDSVTPVPGNSGGCPLITAPATPSGGPAGSTGSTSTGSAPTMVP